jgi:archaellum component FlaF (FlaF/FlaG flagellin family)
LGGVVMLGTIALVVALVWVGALFVFAQGAEEKIRDARNALMWTVIGGLVLLGAQSISIVIQNTVQSLQ